ncbi:hypothetical protein [Streptomyces sp. 142MFCol3.1]|uniref:hypothetical protein n=1 Tax=Streptomyces sp. 142MFCol3.1 TaxID=1172179 RepID=UPI000429BDB1|nr:hypothetical protein [Streptomyces sp. 142MFCol3.1]
MPTAARRHPRATGDLLIGILPRSRGHLYYVAAEIAGIVALLCLGVSLLTV